MTLNIRNEEADALARELARIDGISITEAVVTALKEAIGTRLSQETPTQSARRILARRGLCFNRDRQLVPSAAYHDLDHELTGKD
jgi:hypothetical protein